MTVTPEDRDAMANILRMMNGEKPAGQKQKINESSSVELAGAGQITQADVDAMASVLGRLNSLSNTVVDQMITESVAEPEKGEALFTERNSSGVKVGRYQILIKEDRERIAGKQYYAIYNSLTNDTIADDISLYETAITVVRMLNAGKFTNSADVLKLFEQDALYTSHKVDALMYKKKMSASTDPSKRDIFESRYQSSLDRCMAAKRNIKLSAK